MKVMDREAVARVVYGELFMCLRVFVTIALSKNVCIFGQKNGGS